MSSSGTTTSASGTVHCGMAPTVARLRRPVMRTLMGCFRAMTTLAGRSVLVTGAGGFIGGHVVERLVRDGARVRALCRYNSRNERGTLDWLPAEVTADLEVVLGELRDVESVSDAVAGMDVVIHLGAQIAIPYSYA